MNTQSVVDDILEKSGLEIGHLMSVDQLSKDYKEYRNYKDNKDNRNHQHIKDYTIKRKSVTRIPHRHPLIINKSCKAISKTKSKELSPRILPLWVEDERGREDQEVKSVRKHSSVYQTAREEVSKKSTQNLSSNKTNLRRGIYEATLQEQIHKIKSLSRFMLDMKLPSALPSKTKRQKTTNEAKSKEKEPKDCPLIRVTMHKADGFIRPALFIQGDPETEDSKEPSERKKIVSGRPKEKLKTAPEINQFGLQILSHQDAFQQEMTLKEARKEFMKRFRSTWVKRPSVSKKKEREIEVAPWAVSYAQNDN